MTVTNKQIDGSHYVSMKLQPLQLTYLLSETPCFCKVAKYLTRIKNDKLTQHEKALHCTQLEEVLYEINSDNYPEEVLELLPFGHCVNYTTVGGDLAHKLIDVFTEDVEIRKILKDFNSGEFEYAIKGIQAIIDRLK